MRISRLICHYSLRKHLYIYTFIYIYIHTIFPLRYNCPLQFSSHTEKFTSQTKLPISSGSWMPCYCDHWYWYFFFAPIITIIIKRKHNRYAISVRILCGLLVNRFLSNLVRVFCIKCYEGCMKRGVILNAPYHKFLQVRVAL